MCRCAIKNIKHRSLFSSSHLNSTAPSAVFYSHISSKQWAGSYADPVKLTEDDLSTLHCRIRERLEVTNTLLNESSSYYFDGHGKMFRPMTVNLVSKMCNRFSDRDVEICEGQYRIMMISEMIHTASLLHDDVIDDAITRRNKPSVNKVYKEKQAVFAGNFVLSRASILLAEIGNTRAVDYFSRILDDLVRGELQQLVSGDAPSERFTNYIQKTYRKTASLVAHSCKIAALLSGCSELAQEQVYLYGKNLGIAFQLIDDALDFVATSEELGKPSGGADMSLGLATAPVLFAAERHSDLHAMIGRKFRKEGDVITALNLVHQSNGIEETFALAQNYANEAVRSLHMFEDCIEKSALTNLCNIVLKRSR